MVAPFIRPVVDAYQSFLGKDERRGLAGRGVDPKDACHEAFLDAVWMTPVRQPPPLSPLDPPDPTGPVPPLVPLELMDHPGPVPTERLLAARFLDESAVESWGWHLQAAMTILVHSRLGLPALPLTPLDDHRFAAAVKTAWADAARYSDGHYHLYVVPWISTRDLGRYAGLRTRDREIVRQMIDWTVSSLTGPAGLSWARSPAPLVTRFFSALLQAVMNPIITNLVRKAGSRKLLLPNVAAARIDHLQAGLLGLAQAFNHTHKLSIGSGDWLQALFPVGDLMLDQVLPEQVEKDGEVIGDGAVQRNEIARRIAWMSRRIRPSRFILQAIRSELGLVGAGIQIKGTGSPADRDARDDGSEGHPPGNDPIVIDGRAFLDPHTICSIIGCNRKQLLRWDVAGRVRFEHARVRPGQAGRWRLFPADRELVRDLEIFAQPLKLWASAFEVRYRDLLSWVRVGIPARLPEQFEARRDQIERVVRVHRDGVKW